MWYCGSICAAFMWRYMIPSLTPPSGRFMTCQKYTQKRLILLTYFWAIEAFLGILALRSLNYVNEEARDKVTPKSALIKMQVFSLLRNAFKNKPSEGCLGHITYAVQTYMLRSLKSTDMVRRGGTYRVLRF